MRLVDIDIRLADIDMRLACVYNHTLELLVLFYSISACLTMDLIHVGNNNPVQVNPKS